MVDMYMKCVSKMLLVWIVVFVMGVFFIGCGGGFFGLGSVGIFVLGFVGGLVGGGVFDVCMVVLSWNVLLI